MSGTRQPCLPINESAATARVDMVRGLATWSGLVADKFMLMRPRHREVGELAAFLHQNLDRLLSHQAAADFVEEISSMAQTARRAAYVGSSPSWDLGRCIHLGCDARISAVIHAHDETSPHNVRCDAGHSWPPDQWLLLAHRLENASPTTSEIREG